jgi:peptide/nickel transport system permease protein
MASQITLPASDPEILNADAAELRSRPGFMRRFMRRLWHNKLALVTTTLLVLLVLACIGAPLLTHQNPNTQSLLEQFSPPMAGHPLGMDELGRDEWSRLLYGGRLSMLIGLTGAVFGMVIGVVMGSLAGYIGGWVDEILMRAVDILLSFPGILLAILIAAVLGPSVTTILVALTVWWTPVFARIVRGNILQARENDYVQAAAAMGAARTRILVRHILPNTMSAIVVQFTLSVASSILTTAALSFLGLGVQPPTAEWGAMVYSGADYLQQDPTLVLYPGAAIFLAVFSINVLGDVLLDVLDPKMD